MQIIFNEIPFSNPDLNAPGRGAEQWHDRNDVNVPTEGQGVRPYDVYYRTTWNRFEGSQNGWNWNWLDSRINDAITKKQTFSFGIMSVYTGVDSNSGGVNVDGAWASFPEYLLRLMQAENPKPFKAGGSWIPNMNSNAYHGRCLALNTAINAHVMATSFQSVRYRDVIGCIDVRLYGNWGEWHSAYSEGFSVDQYPSGTFPTAASLKKIVDAHTQGFPDFPLVAMINGFDAGWLGNIKNPPEIAHYLLTTKNNWGELGWRRDNWGAFDSYVDDELINNNRSFGSSGPFKNLIMAKWTKTPITGEPPSWNPGDYSDLENQVRKYRITSFGNGNYGMTPNTTMKNRVRAAFKACGYRFKVVNAETNISGNNLEIKMNWQNVGIGNCYQNWDVVFELVGTNWKGISKHKLKFFQPKGSPDLITETFAITGVNAGNYPLRFSVKDPNGFRVNMPLAIQGGDSSMNYSLGSVQVGSTPEPIPNKGPVITVDGNKEITLPVDNVLIHATAIDPDGTVQTILWERVSGSGTPDTSAGPWGNVTIKGLKEGTSVFKITATDDKGLSANKSVSVKVNRADVPDPPDPPDPPTPPKPLKMVDVLETTKTTYKGIFEDGSSQEITK